MSDVFVDLTITRLYCGPDRHHFCFSLICSLPGFVPAPFCFGLAVSRMVANRLDNVFGKTEAREEGG